ncbi:MAG: hypothetical protein KC635_29195 [Myxococcales bacterium]|nr:hypothetical protein [Myxococcales bacterium]
MRPARPPLLALSLLALALTASAAACSDDGGGAACVVAGVSHPDGSTFPAPDGCNTCQCHDGAAECTLLGCAPTCTYDGEPRPVGDTFVATDGCNTCTCLASLAVSCTERACADACTAELPCSPTEGRSCRATGERRACGHCVQVPPDGDCQTDAECQSGDICAVPACACVDDVKTCVPGCASAAECGEAEVCGADHRCAPSACESAADCPRNFRCDAGGCLRAACTTSDGCDDLCVNDRCWSEPGVCELPVP